MASQIMYNKKTSLKQENKIPQKKKKFIQNFLKFNHK